MKKSNMTANLTHSPLWWYLLGLYLIAVVESRAVPVLKVDAEQTMAAVPHGAKRKWKMGEYLCVRKAGQDIACGPVTKTTNKGAIVKFSFQTGDEIAAGDEVVFKRSAQKVDDIPEEPSYQAQPSRAPKPEAPRAETSVEDPPAPEVSMPDVVVERPKKRTPPPVFDDSVENDLKKLQVETSDEEVAPVEPPPPVRTRPTPKLKRSRVVEPKEDEGELPPEEEIVPPPRPKKKKFRLTDDDEEEEQRVAAEKIETEKLSSSAAPGSDIPHGSPSSIHHGALTNRPKFRALFDWWLTHQPGRDANNVSVTFDTYHYLMLFEIAPLPELYFGFEVNTSPRFYELDWQLSRSFTLRFGRIYIPFDDLSPHSYFGGRANLTKLSQPGASSAFLPDLFTDLGVGLKWTMARSTDFGLEAHGYIVNGFQSGGISPGNDLTYPNFSSISSDDNNDAKSVGGRLQMSLMGDTLRVGGSIYYGRYSARSQEEASLLMVGVDGKVKFDSFEIRGGYAFMNVGVVPADSFVRGGFYVELSQYFGNFRVSAVMGQSQNDSRAVQATDQTIVGGALAYRAGPIQVSLEHTHDLNQVEGKTYYGFTGLRVNTML